MVRSNGAKLLHRFARRSLHSGPLRDFSSSVCLPHSRDTSLGFFYVLIIFSGDCNTCGFWRCAYHPGKLQAYGSICRGGNQGFAGGVPGSRIIFGNPTRTSANGNFAHLISVSTCVLVNVILMLSEDVWELWHRFSFFSCGVSTHRKY